MTTIVFSRKHGKIAADSRNTDSTGSVVLTNKIELLKDGRYFLGSGHCLTIGKAKRWAEKNFTEKSRPEFGALFGDDKDNFAFSCLVISPDGKQAILIDDEMEPQDVLDDFLGVGTGAAYALGALEAGATPEDALAIAIARDGNSGGPIRVADLRTGRCSVRGKP